MDNHKLSELGQVQDHFDEYINEQNSKMRMFDIQNSTKTMLERISNLVSNFFQELKQIYKESSMGFQLNTEWAFKVIMNVIAPVQLRVPKILGGEYFGYSTEKRTEPYKYEKFDKYQRYDKYDLEQQAKKIKKSESKKMAQDNKRNRQSYPMPSSFTNTLIITAEDAQPAQYSAPPLLGQDIEKAIISWAYKKLENNQRIYIQDIREKARELSKGLDVPFNTSQTWLRGFFSRNLKLYNKINHIAEPQFEPDPSKIQFEEVPYRGQNSDSNMKQSDSEPQQNMAEQTQNNNEVQEREYDRQQRRKKRKKDKKRHKIDRVDKSLRIGWSTLAKYL